MRLSLVRHAQSAWQLAPSADLDAPLTPVGREQARVTARWLTRALGEPAIVNVLTSPLQRARDTAAEIAGALRVRLICCDELAEAPFDLAAHLPVAPSPVATPAPTVPSAAYVSFKAQVQRALGRLLEHAAMHDGRALAVTHGGVIKTLVRIIAGADHISCELGNASLSALEWKDQRWHVSYLNRLEHLPEELRTR